MIYRVCSKCGRVNEIKNINPWKDKNTTFYCKTCGSLQWGSELNKTERGKLKWKIIKEKTKNIFAVFAVWR